MCLNDKSYVGNKFNNAKNTIGDWEAATVAHMATIRFSCFTWWQCCHMVLRRSSNFIQILPHFSNGIVAWVFFV
jgi:hypothetical protein